MEPPDSKCEAPGFIGRDFNGGALSEPVLCELYYILKTLLNKEQGL